MKGEAFTHFDASGAAHMVDVTGKEGTVRVAEAAGQIRMSPRVLSLVMEGSVGKGDVLGVARVAGIMAAKATSDLIPLCHNVNLTAVGVDLTPDEDGGAIQIRSRVVCKGETGVEMEALTAVSIAALTVYDMCKALDRTMVVDDVKLMTKSGGKSGEYRRED